MVFDWANWAQLASPEARRAWRQAVICHVVDVWVHLSGRDGNVTSLLAGWSARALRATAPGVSPPARVASERSRSRNRGWIAAGRDCLTAESGQGEDHVRPNEHAGRRPGAAG